MLEHSLCHIGEGEKSKAMAEVWKGSSMAALAQSGCLARLLK